MHKLPSGIKVVKKIRVGAKALITHQDKILVIQEQLPSNHPEANKIIYDFPGGGINKGEKLETGLKREVFEEIGINIKVKFVVGAWDFIVPSLDDHATGIQIVCLGYQCELQNSLTEHEPKLDLLHNPARENIINAGWLTPSKILATSKPMFDNPDVIKAIKRLSF
jgi:ADP-ribose pyrophosphatase YjhB (NUDIX family)